MLPATSGVLSQKPSITLSVLKNGAISGGSEMLALERKLFP
jgi:hypothetical protein